MNERRFSLQVLPRCCMDVVSSCVRVMAVLTRRSRRQLLTGNAGTPAGLPPQGERKAGMTSNQHGSTSRGEHVLNGRIQREAGGELSGEPESRSQFRIRKLQPDSVKLYSLVIAHQPWRGEYVHGLYTPPVSFMGAGCLKCVAARRAPEKPVTGLSQE